MASYHLEPVSMSAPTAEKRFLDVAFRLPSGGARDSIYPATGLQVSVCDTARDMEVFLERATSRNVVVHGADATLRSLRIPESEVPRMYHAAAASLTVKLHAWRGEKWLGTWELGTLEQEACK